MHKEHVLRSSDESVHGLFDAESRAFRYSTDNSSTLESTELVYYRLDFENDLFTSRVYERNYGYSAESGKVMQPIQKDHTDRRVEDGPRRLEQDQAEIDDLLKAGLVSRNYRLQFRSFPTRLPFNDPNHLFPCAATLHKRFKPLRLNQYFQRTSVNHLDNLRDHKNLYKSLPSEPLVLDKVNNCDDHQVISNTEVLEEAGSIFVMKVQWIRNTPGLDFSWLSKGKVLHYKSEINFIMGVLMMIYYIMGVLMIRLLSLSVGKSC